MTSFQEYLSDFKDFPSPPKLTRQNAACDLSQFDLTESIQDYDEEVVSPFKLRYSLDDILYREDDAPHPLDLNFKPYESEEDSKQPVSPPNSVASDNESENVQPEDKTVACAPLQSLTDGFRSILHDNIHVPTMLESFHKLAQALMDIDIGNCRRYHSTLNDWLSARLSRVTAAQMMVRFFANDKQICFIFQEIQDRGLINRHIRSCIRSYQRVR